MTVVMMGQMASFNQRMIKYPQMGCSQGYVTIFLTCGTLPWCQALYILVFRLKMTSTIQR